MIRVLFADDAAMMRRLISKAFGADPQLEIAKECSDGVEILTCLEEQEVDIIVVDIQMRKLDGIEVIKAIRKKNRTLPIIVFSSLAAPNSQATVDALSAGATDYVLKPKRVGHVHGAIQQVTDELIPKIKLHANTPARTATKKAPPFKSPTSPFSPKPLVNSQLIPGRFGVIVVAVSTGGPMALEKMLKPLPASFPLPILIVQHMPPTFTKRLAESLSQHCKLPVNEAEQASIVRPGEVWIAPGGKHMQVVKKGIQKQLMLNSDPPVNSCRPAADVLFQSVVPIYKQKILAVVLTGMGKDGAVGCEEIKKAGGAAIAQDKSSSAVWGMPGEIVGAGLADVVLPIDQIGLKLVELSQSKRQDSSRSSEAQTQNEASPNSLGNCLL